MTFKVEMIRNITSFISRSELSVSVAKKKMSSAGLIVL